MQVDRQRYGMVMVVVLEIIKRARISFLRLGSRARARLEETKMHNARNLLMLLTFLSGSTGGGVGVSVGLSVCRFLYLLATEP